MEKYTYEINYSSEARSQAFIARGLKALANEKAIANRISAITVLLSSEIAPSERIRLEDELRHI